jgi:hypothetical protein
MWSFRLEVAYPALFEIGNKRLWIKFWYCDQMVASVQANANYDNGAINVVKWDDSQGAVLLTI